MMPDFFIVGQAKSGTTALYEMLRLHPQIYMPVKEPCFFSRELYPHSEDVKHHPQTLDQYLSLFTGVRPGQLVGEATPSYLRSLNAARRIAELRPDARIIAILREPASLVRSLHLELLRDHVETEKDLRRAIALEQARVEQQERSLSYVEQWPRYSVERVRYVEQLQRYHAAFPPEQVLVLIYDDFRADNEATVSQVLRFLNVDDTAPIEVTEANPTAGVRSMRLYGLVRSLYLGEGQAGRIAKAMIKVLTPKQLRRDAHATIRRRVLLGDPPPPDEELMLELRRRFKGEVVALSEYLGRDLVTLWGYDGIS
jgi:hypothetical protein